jgi:glucose/arabinose dehydrogenase
MRYARVVLLGLVVRLRAPAILALAAVLLLLVGADGRSAAADPTEDGYSLTLFAAEPEFNEIVDLAVIPGQEDQAIVAAQRDDLLWRISLTGSFAPVLYGDLTAVSGGDGNEEGLLSVTFSPEFEEDGRVYVYYTQGSPEPSIVSRFDATATDLDEGTEQVILQVPQPNSNHNGGRLLFGPDGYLYLSLGDGGGGGDPEETGQDNTDLLGSVLRIAVTGETTYSVPAGNPFVGVSGADEVWAYGLRNPWRYSFDSVTGELWLGDVGQGAWEEVEEIVEGGNYGWDCYEGFDPYEPAGCPGTGFEFPRATYDHGLGCAVTGGYVYRGDNLPEIYGWYVYGDYCSGRIWAVNPADSSDPVQLINSPYSISSFAELADGELLVLTFQGAIYQLDCDNAVDADGDGLGNACDACPVTSTPWSTPGGDEDCDGWESGDETFYGTLPLTACPATATAGDEDPDAWPPDFNDSRSVDVNDLLGAGMSFKNSFGASDPNPLYFERYDLSQDGSINVFDLLGVPNSYKSTFGLSCS